MIRHISVCLAAAIVIVLIAAALSCSGGAQEAGLSAKARANVSVVKENEKEPDPGKGRRSEGDARPAKGDARPSKGGGRPDVRWAPASRKAYEPAKRPNSKIKRIVIHVAQAPAGSVVNTFQNGNVAASSHYVVSAKGEVIQMVPDRSIAWHAGNRAYNATSIGIEHAGFVEKKASLTKPMYRASARLVAHLAKKYAVPIDRSHVIGHNEVPDPSNPRASGGHGRHTDPGPHWKWREYIRAVRAEARQDAGVNATVAAAGTTAKAKKSAGGEPSRARVAERAG